MHCVAEPFKAHPFAVASEKTIAQLGDEIAVLSAHIQAATYRLLVLIREFEDLNGWEEGFSSCARWLSWRVGLAPGAAREKVRVARALAELPVMSEAMRQGELSYSKVRALTRVATPQNEERLLGFAQAGTAHHVERVVRAWRGIDARKELQRDTARHGKRYFRIYTDDDGMVIIRGRLTPEVGAVVMRALEAAQDKLYLEQEQNVPAGTPEVEQNRADALALVAEAAL